MCYVGHINAPARPSEQIDRRLTRAHNRYLSALRALAAVRRLDLTLVNVNLGAGPVGLGSGKRPAIRQAVIARTSGRQSCQMEGPGT
jgi:hypothetical protein